MVPTPSPVWVISSGFKHVAMSSDAFCKVTLITNHERFDFVRAFFNNVYAEDLLCRVSFVLHLVEKVNFTVAPVGLIKLRSKQSRPSQSVLKVVSLFIMRQVIEL